MLLVAGDERMMMTMMDGVRILIRLTKCKCTCLQGREFNTAILIITHHPQHYTEVHCLLLLCLFCSQTVIMESSDNGRLLEIYGRMDVWSLWH